MKKLNFSGDCKNRTRSGEISFKLEGNTWREKDAKLTINFVDYKITRKSDNKSIVINGTKTITNLTGGLAWRALSIDSVASVSHSITGKVTISFDNGTAREYEVTRKRTFDFNKISIASSNSSDNIIAKGKNRFGNEFVTSISTISITIEKCTGKDYFVATSGALQHTLNTQNSRTVTVLYGVNSSGNIINSCEATGYSVTWSSANRSGTRYFNY
jgi:hypothetical protein